MGLASLLLFILIWAVVTAASILSYMHESSPRTSDAAIVLGAAVQGDIPSPVFRERIEQAIRLYRAGTVRNLIFTGGSSQEGIPAEALVGRQYALTQGVKPEHIQVEDKSVITQENLIYALEIGKREGYRTYTIVSDPLHMKRSMKMAAELGMDAVPSPTQTTAYHSWSTQIPFLVREIMMYMGYTVRGWT
ncbi:YdcF family protein [Paenibacillus polysaccharolyticus]|uniref:YdcF family protein n=1 Tax=Paenibacillus polysaccharolyticus TaxID=582692 RepID=UPI0020421D8F|nr:YdcF family protein [Paenibacillus polysaccharolyticus]MCM3132075.1 YdcF family protein [Paenibacillus polysaccharolyticus]